MTGRFEHQLQRESKIKEILSDMPKCVSDYYYYLAESSESTTCLEYIRKIRQFLLSINPDMSQIDFTTITEPDISRYLADTRATRSSDGTIRETKFSTRKQHVAVLRSFFDYLYRSKIISENPMANIKSPKNKDKIQRYKLGIDDIYKILEAVENGAGSTQMKNYQAVWKERDRAIIMMFANTGMRKTALSEINVSDVLDGDYLTITDKRSKQHTYRIEQALRESIDDWLKKREILLGDEKCDALFISNRRRRMSETAIDALVGKYSAAGLGFRISPHKLRAAFIEILLDETGDIEFTRQAVGHSNIATTQRYVAENREAKHKAANILDSKLRGIG